MVESADTADLKSAAFEKGVRVQVPLWAPPRLIGRTLLKVEYPVKRLERLWVYSSILPSTMGTLKLIIWPVKPMLARKHRDDQLAQSWAVN